MVFTKEILFKWEKKFSVIMFTLNEKVILCIIKANLFIATLLYDLFNIKRCPTYYRHPVFN